MSSAQEAKTIYRYCGRDFTIEEMDLIRRLIAADPPMNRAQLSRAVCDEVLRLISINRQWTRRYQVKLALVTNPRCPQVTAMQLVNHLHEKDLLTIMKSKDVPGAIAGHARRALMRKGRL